MENSKVAVYLVYATAAGHAAIDRELYIPRSWTDDADRRRAAGIPDEVAFATKPAPATAMITRSLDAGIGARWVTGDEVYGANPHLRAALEARRTGYVLAVACDHQALTRAGKFRPTCWPGSCPHEPGNNAPQAPEPRDCASTTGPWPTSPTHSRDTTNRWSATTARTGELAFYRC
ncbi:transposase [Streptomyces sp. NPDC056464]|uniref:transposase n=1 Tax=Streptomyces sp. NPDC056464 TaxID=3345828 RepID=UPI0036907CB6